VGVITACALASDADDFKGGQKAQLKVTNGGGFCLRGQGDINGKPAKMKNCDSTDLQQQWEWVSLGGNNGQIKVKFKNDAGQWTQGRCLDSPSKEHKHEGKVALWKCHDASANKISNQKWTYKANGQIKLKDGGKCLHAPGLDKPVLLRHCDLSKADKQVWSCVTTKAPTKSPTTKPTKSPTTKPTKSPTTKPTKSPTTKPTKSPTTDTITQQCKTARDAVKAFNAKTSQCDPVKCAGVKGTSEADRAQQLQDCPNMKCSVSNMADVNFDAATFQNRGGTKINLSSDPSKTPPKELTAQGRTWALSFAIKIDKTTRGNCYIFNSKGPKKETKFPNLLLSYDGLKFSNWYWSKDSVKQNSSYLPPS